MTSLFASSDSVAGINTSDEDIYGFEKVLVMLSNQGKIFAVSSLTGETLWTHFNAEEPAR